MKWIACVISACAFFSGLSAQAQEAGAAVPNSSAELEQLRKTILDQQKVIADCIQRIDKLEAAGKAQDSKAAEDLKEIKSTLSKSGLANIKVSGDLRYRLENTRQDPENLATGIRAPFKAPDSASSRTRHLLRLRLGAEWNVNDEWTVGARVATALNGNPVSSNQGLSTGYSKKDLWLDLAYFNYHPSAVKGLEIQGGKIENPFYTPGRTQLVWDVDLTPEGLALSYQTRKSLLPWELGVTAGYFMVDERPLDYDAEMFGIQATARYNLREDGLAGILAGLSYYDYVNAQGYPLFYANNDNFGNSLQLAVINGLANNGLYAEDFNLLEVFAEIDFPVGKIPFQVFGDLVWNAAAKPNAFDNRNADIGWATGLTVGKCSNPGTWSLRYEYRDVERDAVVGAFTDSEFGGGGTNARGHLLAAQYMLAKNTRVGFNYYLNHSRGSDWIRMLPNWGARENVDGRFQRFQLELNLKF